MFYRNKINEMIKDKESKEKLEKMSRFFFPNILIKRGDFTAIYNNTVRYEVKTINRSLYIEEYKDYTITFIINEEDNNLKLEFIVPLYRKYHYEISTNILKLMNEELLSKEVEIANIELNGSTLNITKKLSKEVMNTIYNLKVSKDIMKSFIKKTGDKPLTEQDILKIPEIYKNIEKVNKEIELSIKKDNEQLKLKDSEYTNIENKISKKEHTKIDQIVAINKDTYIIFDNAIENKQEIRNLLKSYDTENWAVDSDYKKIENKNKEILTQLRKYGLGTFKYITHPNGTPSFKTITL